MQRWTLMGSRLNWVRKWFNLQFQTLEDCLTPYEPLRRWQTFNFSLANTRPSRLYHVNFLIQIVMEEYSANVKLPNIHVLSCTKRKNYYDGLTFYNQLEGLIIINPLSLSETLGNQSSFVLGYLSCKCYFDLMHPLARHWLAMCKQISQDPSVVLD